MISSKPTIQEETTAVLYKLIRMSHPEDEGEKWDRWQVMDELERRGMNVFEEIGWSGDLGHIYKNRYTACEMRLIEVLVSGKINEDEFHATSGEDLAKRFAEINQQEETIEHNIFNVLECWMPAEVWDPRECFKEYLPKEHNPNTLSFWTSKEHNSIQHWSGCGVPTLESVKHGQGRMQDTSRKPSMRRQETNHQGAEETLPPLQSQPKGAVKNQHR